MATGPYLHSTHRSSTSSFSKTYTPSIQLIAHHGVHGDFHAGPKVKQRDLAAASPSSPNLRQIHLIPYELFNELAPHGFGIGPGELGENVTTYGIDLLGLPRDTYLYFGSGEEMAVVRVTGLRDPGKGVEKHREGLLGRVKYLAGDGTVVRRCEVMGVVAQGGTIKSGDVIRVVYPEVRYALGPVEPVFVSVLLLRMLYDLTTVEWQSRTRMGSLRSIRGIGNDPKAFESSSVPIRHHFILISANNSFTDLVSLSSPLGFHSSFGNLSIFGSSGTPCPSIFSNLITAHS
jgi:MOSC domain-containing protein YiiM